MVVVLSTMVTLVSLLACAELEGRERRMRAGARLGGSRPDRRHRRQRPVSPMPGVSLMGDGTLRFDPGPGRRCPCHVTGSLVDHRLGHGASLSLGGRGARHRARAARACPKPSGCCSRGAAGYKPWPGSTRSWSGRGPHPRLTPVGPVRHRLPCVRRGLRRLDTHGPGRKGPSLGRTKRSGERSGRLRVAGGELPA